MTDSKSIEMEIEKLEKQQFELQKTLDLLKKSKQKMEKSEKTKAENLFYKGVNELVAAANLKLHSKLGDLVRLTFNQEFHYIYLHESSVNYTKSALARLLLNDRDIDRVSRWIEVILENTEVLRYLLNFKHQSFTFQSIDVYTGLSFIKAFFSSSDFHLHIDFLEDNNARVSMSNYIDDDFRDVEINVGDVTYYIESESTYDGFSIKASIEKDCQLNELDAVIEESVAKLKNHGVKVV